MKTPEQYLKESDPNMLEFINEDSNRAKIFETMKNYTVDVLDSYNEFLLNNQYTDCDIICEEPTALDQFLILNEES